MFQEEQNRGKPNWEHLNEELHVLISVDDTENRAKLKLAHAVDEVKKLLVPTVSNPSHIIIIIIIIVAQWVTLTFDLAFRSSFRWAEVRSKYRLRPKFT